MSDPVHIYTDGAASGNPGPGGYGIVMLYKNHRKEFSEGFKLTTNNRMELMAVIVALEQLKKNGLSILIYSDSKYVVDSIEKKWLDKWQLNNFKKTKNTDLWLRLIPLLKKHKVKFNWVKGHAANIENNRCDELAVAAYKLPVLKNDTGYRSENAGAFDGM